MQRTIKSFVLRAGRISNRQQQGLDEWLVEYELPLQSTPWDFAEVFGRSADTIVEIGFGMGASLIEMAKERAEINFIGIEVHRAGIGSLAADLHDLHLQNVRIVPRDAVETFRQNIPDNSLSGIQIFFPDPWPKKKHHKRRLIQPEFIDLLIEKLKPQGFIHCATDWQDYAEHILSVLTAKPTLMNQKAEGLYVEKPATRPTTKFEQRGQRLGHGTWDLVFTKK